MFTFLIIRIFMFHSSEVSIMKRIVSMQHFMIYYEFYYLSWNILAVQYRIDHDGMIILIVNTVTVLLGYSRSLKRKI